MESEGEHSKCGRAGVREPTPTADPWGDDDAWLADALEQQDRAQPVAFFRALIAAEAVGTALWAVALCGLTRIF
jgi:hypothetical protein